MQAITEETRRLFSPINLWDTDRLKLSLDDKSESFIARVYSFEDGIETFASYAARYKFFRRFPERKQLTGNSEWLIPATDISVALMDTLFPTIEFATPETGILFKYIRMLGEQKDSIAARVAKYKEDKEAPTEKYLTGHPAYPLADYQKVGLRNSINNEGYGLFMEQGTGKTPVVIARVCHESVKTDNLYRCLILCPKGVRMNWESEFHKFATVPGKVTVVRGSEIMRAKLLVDAMKREEDCEYSIVVMSYDNLARTWALFQMIQWDLAVLDESHYIKSPTTKRWKYCQKLRDRSKARMCLTGTPITNTPLDLYTQFEFLGKGWSGFSSWKNFRSFYGVFEQGYNGYEKLVGMQNLPFMQERLVRQSFMVTKKEALPELPDKVYDVYEVEMTPKQREIYEKLATELALEIENELDSNTPKQLLISNILTQLLRLAQITSGFIVWDAHLNEDGEVISPKEIEPLTPNPKLEALVELLKDKTPNDKTIVWACWVQDILTIKERLEKGGIGCVTFYGATSDKDRAQAEYLFNNDYKTSVFIGNPAAGGTGLNLLGHPPTASVEECSSACTHEIYYSQNWSPTARSQSEDRAHRRGTRQHVRITDLCVPESIDEEIRMRVLEKHDVALRVSDVRKILKSII